MRSLTGFEFLDDRAELMRRQQDNPGLSGSTAEHPPTHEDAVADDMARLDAEAQLQSALRLPPIVHFINDLMRHFERQVSIPTTSEIPDDAEPRYRRPYSVER